MNPNYDSKLSHNENCETVDWLPFAATATLVLLAMTNRSKLLGIGALLGGGYLLKRAIDDGTLQVPPELMDKVRTQIETVGRSAGLIDRDSYSYDVDEASAESFPASDPPARY